MERWDEAVKYGERAVNLEPQNATYHLWLGREYGRKAADSNPLSAAVLAKKAQDTSSSAQCNSIPPMFRPESIWRSITPKLPRFMGGGLDKARAQAAAGADVGSRYGTPDPGARGGQG